MRESVRQRLYRMARQTESPHEAIVACRKLGIAPSGEVLWAAHQEWKRTHVEVYCPGCQHSEFQHTAGMCYTCGYCHWSILGEGNAWGLPSGWNYRVLESA